MDKDLVKDAHALRDSVEDDCSAYYHSTPLVKSTHTLKLSESTQSYKIRYDLKDILFIGAITENPVLLTGSTDLGKTALSCLMMNSLFGEEEKGWHRLDFDLDFSKDSFTNVNSDFFHQSGKSLSDLYSIHEWMRLPGFIADELNGGHSKIIRKAIHIIKEKDITMVDGRRVKIGKPIEDGSKRTYQYQIATINEGSEYSGTFEMDKALRRRTTIEIPLDIFRPSPIDLAKMRKADSLKILHNNKEDRFERIIRILNEVEKIPIHPAAELFLGYLESFDYCKNSDTGFKDVAKFNYGSLRSKCSKDMGVGSGMVECRLLHILKDEMCPYVRGLSPGLSKDMISVARGAALLRAIKFSRFLAHVKSNEKEPAMASFISALEQYTGKKASDLFFYKTVLYKYIENLEVEYEDLIDIVPFVIYSKMEVSKHWAGLKHGSTYEALKSFLGEIDKKYVEGLENLEFPLDSDIDQALLRHLEDHNPWMLQAIRPYIEKEPPKSDISPMSFYG